MRIDRKRFYDEIRQPLFGGKLNQSQVEGIEVKLNYAECNQVEDKRHLAYILATVFHETGKTMLPVPEYGMGRGKMYGRKIDVDGEPYTLPDQIYYGRGDVQLTWRTNYMLFSKRLSIPLLANPDLMLNPKISVQVLFDGMKNGLFTGVGLNRYFNETKTDWVNARRIINGTDKADLIADYAKIFYRNVV
jgi:putative chitinase